MNKTALWLNLENWIFVTLRLFVTGATIFFGVPLEKSCFLDFFYYFFSFSFLLSKYGAFLCFLRGTVLTRMHRSKTPELSSSIFADLTMLCVRAVFLESFGSAVQKWQSFCPVGIAALACCWMCIMQCIFAAGISKWWCSVLVQKSLQYKCRRSNGFILFFTNL